jgi:hypothetical protein
VGQNSIGADIHAAPRCSVVVPGRIIGMSTLTVKHNLNNDGTTVRLGGDGCDPAHFRYIPTSM